MSPQCEHCGGSSSPAGRNPANFLTGLLAVAVIANLLVMVSFTATVNRKLAEAIELGKPQEGTLTVIAADNCPQCRALDAVSQAVKAQNVDLLTEQTVSAGSSEGAALIGKYAIGKLPALVFESDERIKAPLRRAFEKDGRADGETAFVWEQSAPPYFNLAENRSVGLVDVTYLTDKRCAECFNPVQIFQPMLLRFGMQFSSTKTVDTGDPEGAELVKRHSITSVPTVVLSAEAAAYSPLLSSWQRFGTTESDGSLVFRSMDAVRAAYKDLESGKIVQPTPPNPATR